MRIVRWILAVLAGIVLLVLLAAAALWWWTGTDASLQFALRWAARTQPLVVQDAHGSVRTGVRARQLQWSQDGLAVTADDVQLAWQPLALVDGVVRLTQLQAARVRIDDRRPPKPATGPPQSLALPLAIDAPHVRVGEIAYVRPSGEVDVGDVAGAYGYDLVRHRVQIDSVRWQQGLYSGRAMLGARGDLPLDAQVTARLETAVPGSATSLPVSGEARVRGPLADLHVDATVQARLPNRDVASQGTLTAHVTPFAPQPLPEASVALDEVDVAALWPQAPRTRLAGHAQVRPAGTGSWVVSADLRNGAAGPWDAGQLPVERIAAEGEWQAGGVAIVRKLHAAAGGGTIDASGDWRSGGRWAIDARLQDVNPAGLHTALAAVPLDGHATANGEGSTIDFDAALKAREGGARKTADAIAALELRDATARGRWTGETLSLRTLDVHAADASLSASGEWRVRAHGGKGQAVLVAPGMQAMVGGVVAERSGGGIAQVHATDLGQALRWAARLPGVPDAVNAIGAGSADVTARWQGGWRDPEVQATVRAPQIVQAASTQDAKPWTLRDVQVGLEGRLANANLDGRLKAEQGARKVEASFTAQGGRRGEGWRGQWQALTMSLRDPALGRGGAWTLALAHPFGWRWSGGTLDVDAGQAQLKAPTGGAPAALAWDPLHWRQGELRTSGRLSGLQLAWLNLVGGEQIAGSAIGGDMVFDATWNASLGREPRVQASLTRVRGDVSLVAEAPDGSRARVTAGVRDAHLTIASEGEQVTADARWDSERGGSAQVRLATRLARGGTAGWQWPESAPLSGTVQAQLPRIGVWSLLAPPGWRLRGSLAVDAHVAGTRGDPQVTGTLAADDLAMRSVVDGVALQDGRLRARMLGNRVAIDEFVLHGPGTNGGDLVVRGEGGMTAHGPQAQVSIELRKLRASIRSDRALTVSGNLNAKRDASGTVVNGNLVVDQAVIVLPDESTPKLGDDVVVRNGPEPAKAKEAQAQESQEATSKSGEAALQYAIDIDLGRDFQVKGKGIQTRLEGKLSVSGRSVTDARVEGTIRTRGGQYEAYGQRLDIERGIIHFTGAATNPSFDILAIRPNITQRVGVQVTGTAYAPYVRLYSEPDLPDTDKLAWLVTGRAAPATGAEAALVQQAALALLAGRSGTGKRGIAASLGLDELSFRRDATSGPAVTLGKRFGDKFYAAYEHGLGTAVGTVSIFYDITRRFTLRASAGERNAVDVIYTMSFD